jgi:hypothetical protein
MPKSWFSKHKKGVVAATLVACGVIVMLVALVGPKNAGSSERGECEAKCAKANRFGRMVPAIQNQPAKPGAYVGPWKCECY